MQNSTFDDCLSRELAPLPVRVPAMMAVVPRPPASRRDALGWEHPFRLAKVLGFAGVETNGTPVGNASAPGVFIDVELFGIAKSPISLRPCAPNITGGDSGWRSDTDDAPTWQRVADTSAGTFVRTTQPGAEIRFNLDDLPANCKAVRSVKIALGAFKQTGQPLALGVVQIVESDGTTPITEAAALDMTIGTSHTVHAKLVGATDPATWAGAQIRLVANDGPTGIVTVIDIRVDVSYRIDPDVEPTVESTRERVFAFLRRRTLKPGDWCFLHRFLWDYSSTGTSYNHLSGREIFNAPALRGFSVTGGPGLSLSGSGATSDLVIDIAATIPVQDTVTKNSTITVTGFGGFADPVALSIEGLVPGLTASLTPATVTPTGTSAVVLTAQKTLASQRLILIVKGTSGDETREEYRRLRIRRLDGDFSLSLSPTSITVARGQSFSFVASVTSLDDDYAAIFIGFSGLPVNSTYFLPGGIPWLNPQDGYIVGERSTITLPLTIVTWSGISVLGHYTITISAVSRHATNFRSQTIDLEVTA